MKIRWLRVLTLLLAGGLFLQGIAICQSQPQVQRKLFEEIKADAEKGDAKAQSKLALMYWIGEGVAQDRVQAAKWWRNAAEQENAAAQVSLGTCYQLGEGVPKDDAEAVKWYRRAAERNDGDAQVVLGQCYAKGKGVSKSVVEAVRWYRKAADQEVAAAQYKLGRMHSMGEGVPKDDAEAVRWYRKAAAQDFAFGQYYLGVCYENGQGVKRDYVEAAKWYRKAAEQNLADAQYNLGVRYFNGEGAVKDYVEAYKWFLLAGAQGDEDAKNAITVIEGEMSRVQMAEGQRLAREFKPREVPSAGSDASPASIAASRPAFSGTGFFISEDGYLVTNQHVVKEGSQVRLLTANGLVSARVVKVDAGNDLAVLKAEGKFAALPVTSSRSMKLGATAATVGFPNIGLQGFSPKLAKGEIASLAGAQDDPRHFQISAAIQPGNSGGALVDERGNVIGVVVAKLSQKAALATSGTLAENVNYAVKSSFLLGFLESLPDVAARLKEPTTRERKFEDVVKDVERATVLVLVY